MRIKTIMDNLLSNAIKFVNDYKTKAKIDIYIDANKDKAFIKVADNGIGIKKEHQERIYDMFYRGTDQHHGSGIGLYILKECLIKINGTVQLSTEEGVGTTFTLEIPAAN